MDDIQKSIVKDKKEKKKNKKKRRKNNKTKLELNKEIQDVKGEDIKRESYN